MRRWHARIWTYGRSAEGVVSDADTGRSLVPHLRGCPVAYYPEYGYGHEPLAETERRGGPKPDAVIGEILESWCTPDGVDALLELLDGPSRTEISMAYERKLWPRSPGERVEIVTHIWSVDLVARSAAGGRLVREASAALCHKLTGETAPRGRWLDRLVKGLPLPERRPPATAPAPWATPRPADRPARSVPTAPLFTEFHEIRPGGDY